jgi:NADPH2:quinone reductase
MKAILCKNYGPPDSLVVEEVADLTPGPNQVLIETRAIGVNFPDTLIIQNLYQFKPPLPFSPGSECAGVVKAVGAGVTHLKPGQRVAAFTTWGSYAQQVLAEAGKTMVLPDALAFDTAAAFTLAYGTSYHALKDRAALRAGETLLVLGAAGGVGLAAVEIGKALGARVIAAASSANKLEVCRRHGADEVINYDSENLRERIKELTKGNGVDVVYDPVGGPYSEPALRSVAWRGRFLVVGFANGAIPSIALNLTLLKGLSVVGVFWGDFARREPANAAQDLKEMMALLDAGKLKPLVSARYPFERVAEALNSVIARKAVGKIVLVP